jgi:hypothetical protein
LIEPNNWFLFPFLKIISRRDAFSPAVYLNISLRFGLIK